MNRFRFNETVLAVLGAVMIAVVVAALTVIVNNWALDRREASLRDSIGYLQREFDGASSTQSLAMKDLPCPKGVDVRVSENCAYWKAADAAKKSADWSVTAFIVGSLINIIAVIGVGVTFLETRKATNASIISANAAVEAAKQAGNLQKAERAWITQTGNPALNEKLATIIHEFLPRHFGKSFSCRHS